MSVMMKCGHAANATDGSGNPQCAVCVGMTGDAEIIASVSPDLTGRTAKCSCGNANPSSTKLPFFEYCGPGSRTATDICKCGYAAVAHTPEVMARNKALKCTTFEARGPLQFDRQYCGCRGWD